MSRTLSAVLAATALAIPLAVSTPAPSRAQDPGDQQDQMPTPQAHEVEIPDEVPIPEDLRVVVIREDLIPGQFRILDIQLDRAVSEEVITTIANMLRDGDERSYERTYIVYYLPGMEPGAGGWATSHFDPDLEVRILEPAA